MTHWCAQSAINRPSGKDATLQRIRRHAQFLGPRRDALGFTVEGQVPVVAAVASLPLLSGPDAVSRLVIAVVILAFDADAVPIRFRPHVGEKRLEGSTPAFADYDSAPTVSVVCGIVGVGAATDYVRPRLVLSGLTLTVGRTSENSSFTREATATLRHSLGEVAAAELSCRPAFAAAEPSRLATLAPDILQHGQASELLSGQVFHTGRESNRIRVRHERSPESGLPRTATQLQLCGRSHFIGTL